MERLEILKNTIARWQNVPMPSETAIAVGNAWIELNEGEEYITPFSLAAIGSVTPTEVRVVFDSFRKEQTEAPTANVSETEDPNDCIHC